MNNPLLLTFMDEVRNNTLRAPFYEYIQLLGPLFYGMFFGLIAAIIYGNTRSGILLAVYLIIIGALGSQIFGSEVELLFGYSIAIGIAIIFYKGFFERKEY